MNREILRINYPNSPTGMKVWNRQYGTNAYWSGKHHSKRAEDARYFHALTQEAMQRARVRRTPFERPVIITFLWGDNLDIDNHSIMQKMIIDGLKKRLIVDDSKKYVRGVEAYYHDKPYIAVIIDEVEGCNDVKHSSDRREHER